MPLFPLTASGATGSIPHLPEGAASEEVVSKELPRTVFLSLDNPTRAEVDHRLLHAVQWTSNLCGLNGRYARHSLLSFVERFLGQTPSDGQNDVVGRLHRYGLPTLEELCKRLDARSVSGSECGRLLGLFAGKLKDHPDPSSLLLHVLRQHALEPGLTEAEHERVDLAAFQEVHTAVKAQAATIFEGTGLHQEQRAWERAAARTLCETLGLTSPPTDRTDRTDRAASSPEFDTGLLDLSTDALEHLLLRIREAETRALGRPRPMTLAMPPQARPRATPALPAPSTPSAPSALNARPVQPQCAALPASQIRAAPVSLNHALEAGAVRLLACARQRVVEPGDVLDRFVAHFTDHPPTGLVDDQAGNLHRFGLKALHRLCDRMATCADADRVKWTLKEVFNDLKAHKDPSATFLFALSQRLPDSSLDEEERRVLDLTRAHFIHEQIRMRADRLMAQHPDRACDKARGLAERRLNALLGVSPPSAHHDAAEAAAAYHLFPPTAGSLDNLLTGMQEVTAQQLGRLREERRAQTRLPRWPERFAQLGLDLAATRASRAPQFQHASGAPLSVPVQASDNGAPLSLPVQATDM